MVDFLLNILTGAGVLVVFGLIITVIYFITQNEYLVNIILKTLGILILLAFAHFLGFVIRE